MGIICYKNKEGAGYRINIQTEVLEDIDSMLDAVNSDGCTIITEKQFLSMYKKTMDITIMDEDEVRHIGVLTTEAMDLEESL